MKSKHRKIYLLLLMVFSIIGSSAYSLAEYHNQKIIIKFKDGSDNLSEWIYRGRRGEIQEFVHFLGKNNSKPFVRDALLKMIRSNEKSNSLLSAKSSYQNLRRICILEYENGIDSKIAARKMASFDFVEYAEVMPVHKIFYIPDDPKYALQYYLNNIKATEAWDLMDSNSVILAGIVDTGVEYIHDDLKDNMFINPGEIGLDSTGQNKSDNKYDDDGNGFIDDWQGWDFTSDSLGEDSDPKPGHRHGTHLAGTIGAKTNNQQGIAGIVPFVKILPVKVAGDDPNSTSVNNGYEGILYASLMKCDVINCSWGSSTRSQAEQEIINTAISRASVVVSASGNSGKKETFFPAGYDGVLSVTSVGEDDRRSYFSNFERTVDVSAPGDGIYATVSGNWYDFMDGTSMASPVAAGVCGLIKAKFRNLNPLQIIEQVKKTSDNIDTLNPLHFEYMGSGRVNALRAVSDSNTKSVLMTNYSISDENGNGLFEAGENVEISTSYTNMLSPVEDISVSINSNSSFKPKILTSGIKLGSFATLEVKIAPEKFKLKIPEAIPPDYSILLNIFIIEGNDTLNMEFIEIVANPSYRNITDNNIHTTINSIGNIGYNDYPSNYQGIGLKYKNGSDVLFEGALLCGTSAKRVSNVARDGNQNEKDISFTADSIIKIYYVDSLNATLAKTAFKDNYDEDEAGVEVRQSVFQFRDDSLKDFIISIFDVVNTSPTDFDSLFVGLFFDWDIGPSGGYNINEYNFENDFGYQRNAKIDTLPWIGVKMLSSHKMNYFAIDNNGSGGENPGIYGGFSNIKKWQMLSSGMKRTRSNSTDASQMISAGPIRLRTGDTARVAFSIFGGKDLQELSSASGKSLETAKRLKIQDKYLVPLPDKDKITNCYPNPLPANSSLSIEYAIVKSSQVSLELFDIKGKKLMTIINDEYLTRGAYFAKANFSGLSQGAYFLRLKTESTSSVFPFVMTR